MTVHLWLMNLANYSAQVAAMVAAGSFAPALLRVRRPGAMLIYRQSLLTACLLLPFLQPWKRPTVEYADDISASFTTFTHIAPARHFPTLEQAAAVLLCTGVLLRLGWLAIGFERLRRYRRHAQALSPLPTVFETLHARLGVRPAILLSTEVSSPVTFGIRRPAVLLPPGFLAMRPGAQEAIACHELTHVRRRDWAVAMIEEVIRAMFWFHPAFWWLLGQIQLNREQVVDAQVLRITESREQYIEALLDVAGSHLQPDLAPASLFLKKTHLAQRVALIVKEVSMSQKRLLSSLAAICGVLVITARLAVLCFPIGAPAQEVVNGDSNLLHRVPVQYPAEALEQGVQGTVVVSAVLNDRGVVTDAHVVSGPEPLRKAALKSVLDWHYAPRTQSPVTVSIDFTQPQHRAGSSATPKIESGTLTHIQFTGVPPGVRDAVTDSIPVHEGQTYQTDMLPSIRKAVLEADEHLRLEQNKTVVDGRAEFALNISYAPQTIRVGGNMQATKLMIRVVPVYPPAAKRDHIQGKVRLNVSINKDGTVQDVELASGPPELVDVAMDAVRQWVYQPTLLNGAPVTVQTVVDVNFTLRQ